MIKHQNALSWCGFLKVAPNISVVTVYCYSISIDFIIVLSWPIPLQFDNITTDFISLKTFWLSWSRKSHCLKLGRVATTPVRVTRFHNKSISFPFCNLSHSVWALISWDWLLHFDPVVVLAERGESVSPIVYARNLNVWDFVIGDWVTPIERRRTPRNCDLVRCAYWWAWSY